MQLLSNKQGRAGQGDGIRGQNSKKKNQTGIEVSANGAGLKLKILKETGLHNAPVKPRAHPKKNQMNSHAHSKFGRRLLFEICELVHFAGMKLTFWWAS